MKHEDFFVKLFHSNDKFGECFFCSKCFWKSYKDECHTCRLKRQNANNYCANNYKDPAVVAIYVK